MLDRDQIKELHNSVTELHKTTSLAATGSGAIDWEGILNLTINILTLIKSNFSTMHTEFRRSLLDKSETIDEAAKTRQEEHKEALNKNNPPSQPTHPSLPKREGFAENITETVKGNPPNPQPKLEGAPEPKPTDLTLKTGEAANKK